MINEPRLDSIAGDAGKVSGEIRVSYSGGDFWVILPSGAIDSSDGECQLAAMKLPIKRHAVLLVRQLFLRNCNCKFKVGDRYVTIEFRPAVIAGRTREGRSYVRSDESLSLEELLTEPIQDVAEIPDPGDLLDLLEKSTEGLKAIDEILQDPSSVMTEDDAKRNEVRIKLEATKDVALSKLTELGNLLAKGDGGNRDGWLTRVAETSSEMVEAMADIDHLPESARLKKLNLLDDLKHTIAKYFCNVRMNSEAMKSFSCRITEAVLSERREVIEAKKRRSEHDLENTYSAIINVIQSVVPKGSAMVLMPLPEIRRAPNIWCTIILNMHHLVLAVQHGGFHMRAFVDSDGSKRLWNELRAWDHNHHPRIRIVSEDEAHRKLHQKLTSIAPWGSLTSDEDIPTSLSEFFSGNLNKTQE